LSADPAQKFLATDAFFVFLMVQFIGAFPMELRRGFGLTVAVTESSSVMLPLMGDHSHDGDLRSSGPG